MAPDVLQTTIGIRLNTYSMNSEFGVFSEYSLSSFIFWTGNIAVTAPPPPEHMLIQQLLSSLQALPETQASLTESPNAEAAAGLAGATIDLRIAGKSVLVLAEARKSLYPRDIRQILWRLTAMPPGQHGAVLHLLAADLLSPGAKALLREHGIGYFDSGGSLFLPAPGAYVFIDRPTPKASVKPAQSLYTGRRAQVLHTLLSDTGLPDWFGVNHIAEHAQVAASTASNVLTMLEKLDWLASRGSGPGKERQLREPAALLDAWAEQVSAQRAPALSRYFVPGLKADDLINKLAEVFDAHQVIYALSYEAAAQRYAPFLSTISQVRVRVLPGDGATSALAQLGARTVTEGANLVIISAASTGELRYRQNLGGIWLASPVQVYLDLLHGEGRASEMAAHLRQERMGY